MSDSNDKLIEKKLQILSNLKPNEQSAKEAIQKTRQKIMDLENEKTQFNIWRIIMKSPITKLAAAAVIIIAVLIAINQFGGSIDIASRTFAAVVENVNKAKTISWTSRFIIEGQELASSKVMFMEPDLAREEISDGRTIIFDLKQGQALVLNTKIKGAFMTSIATQPFNPYDNFKNFRQIDKCDIKQLGTEIIGNRKAEVFELIAKDNSQKTKVWVDSQTELPFQMESNYKGTEEKPIGEVVTLITSNIVFDEEMDKSLFSLDIPEGYKIMEGKLVSPETGRINKYAARAKSAANMSKIVKACLKYTDEHSGHWPDSLDNLTNYGIKDDILINPGQPESKNGYIYLKPKTNRLSADVVVLYEMYEDWGEGINVGCADGHVEFVGSEDDFKKMLTEN